MVGSRGGVFDFTLPSRRFIETLATATAGLSRKIIALSTATYGNNVHIVTDKDRYTSSLYSSHFFNNNDKSVILLENRDLLPNPL